MHVFQYPNTPHVRRHGPQGYVQYEQYRDWLRDEFEFTCVFCLQREQWVQVRSGFHIDHFIPLARDPGRACDYENLLYACSGCNVVKSDELVPDPCSTGFGKCLKVNKDGTIEASSPEGEMLIQILRLDSDDRNRWRSMWLRIIGNAASADKDLYKELMGYPSDLPDLSKKRPPANTKPGGVYHSCYARKQGGKLPDTY